MKHAGGFDIRPAVFFFLCKKSDNRCKENIKIASFSIEINNICIAKWKFGSLSRAYFSNRPVDTPSQWQSANLVSLSIYFSYLIFFWTGFPSEKNTPLLKQNVNKARLWFHTSSIGYRCTGTIVNSTDPCVL